MYDGLTGYGWVPYGSPVLTETSPPQSFTEPLTLAEVKDFLKLPERSPVDSAEDDTLNAMIAAARQAAESATGIELVRKSIDVAYDFWPCVPISLRIPLVSVELIRYRDSDGNYTTLVENTDYCVDTSKQPGIVKPASTRSWPAFTPWPSSAILIRFTAGYSPTSAWWAEAGPLVRNGMKLLIGHWFNNRLPFEKGVDSTSQYPWTVSECFARVKHMRVF